MAALSLPPPKPTLTPAQQQRIGRLNDYHQLIGLGLDDFHRHLVSGDAQQLAEARADIIISLHLFRHALDKED